MKTNEDTLILITRMHEQESVVKAYDRIIQHGLWFMSAYFLYAVYFS